MVNIKAIVVIIILMAIFLAIMFFFKQNVLAPANSSTNETGGNAFLDKTLGGIANDVTTGKFLANNKPGG